jgi:hypothetical protein
MWLKRVYTPAAAVTLMCGTPVHVSVRHPRRLHVGTEEMERMPKAKQNSMAPNNDGATVGYDALRGSMAAAEKHVVLGLIFLKSLSHAFEATQGALLAKRHRAGRGIDTQSGHGSTFSPDLKTDFLLARGA